MIVDVEVQGQAVDYRIDAEVHHKAVDQSREGVPLLLEEQQHKVDQENHDGVRAAPCGDLNGQGVEDPQIEQEGRADEFLHEETRAHVDEAEENLAEGLEVNVRDHQVGE